MPTTFSTPLETVIPRIKTPPYLIVEPSVQFIDLRPYWEAKPTIMLFTDGVDCLIDGYFNFTPGKNSGGNPYQIVAALLQDGVDLYVEETLGHKVELKRTGPDGNKAVDVLGNLVGGMDVKKLEMVMNQELLADKSASPGFYIDDTSIIIFEVFKAASK